MNHQVPVAQHKTGKGHSPDPSSLTDDVTKMEGRKWREEVVWILATSPHCCPN